ncbi:MAG: stage III sporulation protein AB [Clostridia bacterium]|nr:stage III sporulation protein AB [Clostridia bacterium]
MQLIKIFMLFIVFVLSNYIGKMIAGKYKYRLEELQEMKNNLNIFKTKIKFTYEPIPEIFDEISKTSSKNIGSIFKKAKDQMKLKSAGESWKDAVEETKNNLKEEDKKTLNMLSKMLGESDIDGQVSQIDITLSFLEKQIKEAEEEKEKNEKLYKKLGTIMGLAIVIILI